MSTCVSSHGEFSEHKLGDSGYVCALCGAEDISGLLRELTELRKAKANADFQHDIFLHFQELIREVAGLLGTGDDDEAILPRLREALEPVGYMRAWRSGDRKGLIVDHIYPNAVTARSEAYGGQYVVAVHVRELEEQP